jgi:hypothetical protein
MQLMHCARDGLRNGTTDVPAKPNKSRVEMNESSAIAERGVVDSLPYQRMSVEID